MDRCISASNHNLTIARIFIISTFSPSVARFLIAGDVERQMVESALASTQQEMGSKGRETCEINVPDAPEKSQIYFVDVPGAKQSVISIGAPYPFKDKS